MWMGYSPRIPGLFSTAQTIPEISYSEAAELAYFGAKVVHPSTIQPAVEKNIPVYVKNTKNPLHQGTKIHDKAPGKGLTSHRREKRQITLITVESSRMLNAYGFLSKIFTIFNHYQTPVDLVATSEVSVSMTIEDTSQDGAHSPGIWIQYRRRPVSAKTTLSSAWSGLNLWKESSFVTQVFGALHFTNLKLITLGSSDINLEYGDPGL
jgi:aspartate kinase